MCVNAHMDFSILVILCKIELIKIGISFILTHHLGLGVWLNEGNENSALQS